MKLGLSMQVLDNFSQEAKEVYKHNPWLHFALPLHRFLEMGYHNQLFAALDKRRLELDEIREFFIILFGSERIGNIPNPKSNWTKFVKNLPSIMQQEKERWNPVTKQLSPWVDIEMQDIEYKRKRTCIQCY
jgi:hypothetical protein